MAKSAAELQAEWWADWWKADFSWGGLAKHQVGANGDVVHGGLHREMNLQAYWRRDPVTKDVRDDAAMRAVGELVTAPDGREWHIAHVPLRWQDGVPAKVEWDETAQGALVAVISGRIAAASESMTDSKCNAEAPDGRAQLTGAVLTQALFHPDPGRIGDQIINAICDLALFPKYWASSTTLGAGFRCKFANFCDGAIFPTARFVGKSCFDDSIFFGEARFVGAIFSGYASFDNTIFFEDTRFDNTLFRGDVSFVGAKFYEYASFSTTTASANTRFIFARFFGEAIFSQTSFSGYTNFDGARFSKNSHFNNVIFSGNASFLNVTASGSTKFDGAKFSANAIFLGAQFSGNSSFDSATFAGYATFNDVAFTAAVKFNRVTFAGEARFINAAFLGDASFAAGESKLLISFGQAKFAPSSPSETPGHISFQAWRFNGVAEFDRSSLLSRVEFGAATFARLASFRAITWPDQAANWHGMFSQAVFKDLASFQDAGLSRFAAFDGAVLQGGLQLDDSDEASANAIFQRERTQAATLKDCEGALRQLEGGCRVLKQAMEKSANKSREQIFYAFELMARRHQSGTGRTERVFSSLYGTVADYGRSIGRPLGFLLLLFVLFTMVYVELVLDWRTGILAHASPRAVWLECATFSLQRVLPFVPWTPAPLTGPSVQTALQGTPGSLFGFAIRTLATLQSLLALALAFLAGLALRRRFQMN